MNEDATGVRNVSTFGREDSPDAQFVLLSFGLVLTLGRLGPHDERLDAILAHFERLPLRFLRVPAQFEPFEVDFDRTCERFGRVLAQFGPHEGRFDRSLAPLVPLKLRFDRDRTKLRAHGGRFDPIKPLFALIRQKFDWVNGPDRALW